MNNINTEIFRAYDIRGTYPTTINEQTAFTVGKSYGSYLQEKNIIKLLVLFLMIIDCLVKLLLKIL